MTRLLIIVSTIGRLAPYTLPVGLMLGVLFPNLADFLKNYLILTLFLPLTISLLCTPTVSITTSLLRIRLLVCATLWVLVVSPILIFCLVLAGDISESIALAAVVSAAAPPATAAASIALFLRLNTAIAACVTVLSMLIAPITLPIVFKYLVNTNLFPILWSHGLQLVAFIFTSFGASMLFKVILGEQKIYKNRLILDGISVISSILFTIGIMSGISGLIVDRPWFIFENLIVSTTLVLFLYLFTTLAFWRAGKGTAMAIAIVSGNCNLGLMYLGLHDKVDSDVLVYFSVGQIPMYALPALLTPIVKRLRSN